MSYFASNALLALKLGTKSRGPKGLAFHGLRALAARAMSSKVKYEFETLKVTTPSQYVKHVELNRPDRRNALSMVVVREIGECFSTLAVDPDCRVVVFSGAGKVFSSGIDLNDPEFFQILAAQGETSRKGFQLINDIRKFQAAFTTIEECNKPVIVGVHNACLGLAMDLICTCDIRVCTQDAWFEIREIDLGIAADIGVLQRFPKVVKNDSLAREIIYSTRRFDGNEAKSMGFMSRVFQDQSEMVKACLEMGSTLASKSPVAVQGSKANIVYTRDNGVIKGLEYMTTWQGAMGQSKDKADAVSAYLSKETPTFSKL